VKPAAFEYHAPKTLDEAVELLARGDGTQVLAGGQSLVQLMKFRTAKPRALVDVNGVAGLDMLEERDGELHVGATVRQQRLLDDELVSQWPLLREAAQYVGYKETRRRGTVCGSLAFAAPWAELTAASVALDAAIDVRSTRGERTIAARDFFRGPHQTALEPDELITKARFPRPAARTGAGFHEISVRYRDYAQLAAAAMVTVDDEGTCTAAELVLLRVAETPLSVDATHAVDDESALDELLAGIDPPDDIEASAAHRHRVAPVLARRALRDAAERARSAG
jgi:aerobic carbon-monoxide dehydrogenase medium subunit